MQLPDRPITRRQHRLAREHNEGMRVQDCQLRLPALPIDTQCCVLAFLGLDDLVHFSIVSRACHSVATLDRTWQPLLAKHFNAVKLLARWGPTSARQFSAIAFTSCSVCEDLVLTKQRGRRYRGAHSCEEEGCEELCCAACHCQCSCLGGCNENRGKGDADINVCVDCHAWCHSECGEILSCNVCEIDYCGHCSDVFRCELCAGFFCESCREMSWCNACYDWICDGCTYVQWCESCENSFCLECRNVHCNPCEVSFCDACGHP
jgi:hypothetical protein